MRTKDTTQISMALEDMEKTAFVTDDGIFCYTRMPFWFKNAQAEFQQMVNNIFGDQISWNMEVYVDDIIWKSKKVDILPQDIRETFSKIRHIGMKLNPKKYVFGCQREVFGVYHLRKENWSWPWENQGHTRHARTKECARHATTVLLLGILGPIPGAHGRKQPTYLPSFEGGSAFT